MSQRREIERHIGSLHEISEIMRAMKNLSLMENRKLNRFLATQARVVANIEAVAGDLLYHYPHLLPEVKYVNTLYILIGAERGFCGDFDRRVLAALEKHLKKNSTNNYSLFTIGSRLINKLVDDPHLVETLAAPHIAEEIDSVLVSLIDKIYTLQHVRDGLRVFAIYNEHDGDCSVKQILPPFQSLSQNKFAVATSPALTLSPQLLLRELIDQFLFAEFYQIFYLSLATEHLRRVRHLEGAVHRIDEKSSDLSQKRNAYRQEEIIEEIEEILLSSNGVEQQG